MFKAFKSNPMTIKELVADLISGDDAALNELERRVTDELTLTRELPKNQFKATFERNLAMSELVQNVRRINKAQSNPNGVPAHATVILLKEDGGYDTEEQWRIPEKAITPFDMLRSPDFDENRLKNRLVLVESQYPWGFPGLIKAN
ncbi:hypothetical protein N24_1781 [Corynebacterium suranareeae]|uniref:Uncharacterized protein n=2 Tax=Corynebacterium suranareeae TaxID=2506452 RepID=A0A160PSB4_9CORY|nr:hypothetical protein N24_1781 [Corynebacterium suranareeae]